MFSDEVAHRFISVDIAERGMNVSIYLSICRTAGFEPRGLLFMVMASNYIKQTFRQECQVLNILDMGKFSTLDAALYHILYHRDGLWKAHSNGAWWKRSNACI